MMESDADSADLYFRGNCHKKLEKFEDDLKVNCAKVNIILRFLANKFGVNLTNDDQLSQHFPEDEISEIIDALLPLELDLQPATTTKTATSHSKSADHNRDSKRKLLEEQEPAFINVEPEFQVKYEVNPFEHENINEEEQDTFLSDNYEYGFGQSILTDISTKASKKDYSQSNFAPNSSYSRNCSSGRGGKNRQSEVWDSFITTKDSITGKITSNICKECKLHVSPKVERLREHLSFKCSAKGNNNSKSKRSSDKTKRKAESIQNIHSKRNQNKDNNKTHDFGEVIEFSEEENSNQCDDDEEWNPGTSKPPKRKLIKDEQALTAVPAVAEDSLAVDTITTPDPRLDDLYRIVEDETIGRTRYALWNHFELEFKDKKNNLRKIKSCTCKVCGLQVSAKIERLREHVQFRCGKPPLGGQGAKKAPLAPLLPDIWAKFIRPDDSDNTESGKFRTQKYKNTSVICRACGKRVSARVYRLREHLHKRCTHFPEEERTDIQENRTIIPEKESKPNSKGFEQCEECGKVVVGNGLRRHMLTHLSTRPYLCPICGKSFKRKEHMNYHRKSVHEGIRPKKNRKKTGEVESIQGFEMDADVNSLVIVEVEDKSYYLADSSDLSSVNDAAISDNNVS